MINRKKKNNKGFTLVELLVVIAIIGILAVVAVPSLFKNINKAKAADIIADYSTIKTAVVSQNADQTLITGTYEKAIGTTGKLTKPAGTPANSAKAELDVDDLSKKAGYSLVVDATAGTAVLTITAENNDIAQLVATELGKNSSEAEVEITLLQP